MKRLFYLLLCSTLMVGCATHTQKKWIYENLPQKLWHDKCYEALNQEFKNINDLMYDYGENAINRYNRAGRESDAMGRAIWGYQYDNPMADMLGLNLGTSQRKARANALENFNQHCSDVLQTLNTNLALCLYLCDSTFEESYPVDYDAICSELLGTPGNIPNIESERYFETAKAISISVFQTLERPAVTSCEYNKDKKLWYVRLDNAEAQYVKFFKRDDGEMEAEYSTDANKWI